MIVGVATRFWDFQLRTTRFPRVITCSPQMDETHPEDRVKYSQANDNTGDSMQQRFTERPVNANVKMSTVSIALANHETPFDVGLDAAFSVTSLRKSLLCHENPSNATVLGLARMPSELQPRRVLFKPSSKKTTFVTQAAKASNPVVCRLHRSGAMKSPNTSNQQTCQVQ